MYLLSFVLSGKMGRGNDSTQAIQSVQGIQWFHEFGREMFYRRACSLVGREEGFWLQHTH